MHEHGVVRGEKIPHLINNVAKNLGNAVIFTFKAQGHHWNVEGMKFHMFHAFFAEIYEDVQSSIDPMAENLLKLGVRAPHNLVQFAEHSSLSDSPECFDVYDMLKDLYSANSQFISDLSDGIELASGCGEHGIDDFLTARFDMHKKWQWQIKAHMKTDAPKGRMY
jgi:starvation-inducible DNA-binding protein